MTRDEYIKTTLYKMVFILSGFRRLTCTIGVEFVEELKRIRWKNNKSTLYMTKEFIISVDTGFEQLDAEEIRAYSDYICSAMNYPRNKWKVFYNNLLDYAENVQSDVDGISCGKKAIQQANAIVYLDELIK